MQKLSRAELWSLEQYAEARPEFKKQVIAHKGPRRIAIGPHATLYFEDLLTMKYQVQEMLRVERIFEAAGIEEELETYNPLIPDGSNLKATFMIEYSDAEERHHALATLGGVEDTLWIAVGDGSRIRPITNEDLDRSREDKAAAVHFLRFELDAEAVTGFKSGVTVRMGVDHPQLKGEVSLTAEQQQSLAADLD